MMGRSQRRSGNPRRVLAILVDDDPAARKMSGAIALQMEQYGTGRINFRNLWLKQRG